MRTKQRGVALITAVLIVALVTTIAVAMASRQQLDIRRSANAFDSDQAWLAVLGGEDYARNVLAVDGKESPQVDNLEEDWAQPVQFPFEDMVLSGVVEDMQGRFNLNSLLDSNKAPDPGELARFERLLKLFDLDAAIAQALLDWLDADINNLNGGAEDDYYMQLQPGYRAANRLMASASELRLVRGVTAEAYQKLAPFVVALPTPTKININTAPAAVLAIVADNLTIADGEAMVSARDKKGYGSVREFLDNQPQLKAANIGEEGLSVTSEYFLLNAMAEFDNSRSQQFSLLWRQGGGAVKVIMRGQGAY